ncbi:LPS assembly lipoprotein LptE [candidate division NPL-UPA2 bacterium]|nr:LPS assembly lipoprotein LptE [candidate division NPL-UPA2 bacterium]
MNCKKKIISSLFLLLLLPLAGCGYSPRLLLERDLRTIVLENLENQTFEHGLGVLATRALRDEFIFDGALRVVEEVQADLLLSGAVIYYTLETLFYGRDGRAASRRLRIRAKLTLKNLRVEEVIWQDRIIEGDVRYLLTGPLAKTESQARDKALRDLAREILWQTVGIR